FAPTVSKATTRKPLLNISRYFTPFGDLPAAHAPAAVTAGTRRAERIPDDLARDGGAAGNLRRPRASSARPSYDSAPEASNPVLSPPFCQHWRRPPSRFDAGAATAAAADGSAQEAAVPDVSGRRVPREPRQRRENGGRAGQERRLRRHDRAEPPDLASGRR